MREHIIRHTRRLVIAVIGLIVVVLGIIMIPYPGPGWVVVFAGLAILATEFEFAQKILDKARGKYDQWQEWLKHQNLYVQLSFMILTGLVVLLTAWLINSFGIINSVLNLGQNWLVSPLIR